MSNEVPKRKWLPLLYEDRKYKFKIIHGSWFDRWNSPRSFHECFILLRSEDGKVKVKQAMPLCGDSTPFLWREATEKDLREVLQVIFDDLKKKAAKVEEDKNPPTYVMACKDEVTLALYDKTIQLDERKNK